MPGGPDPLVVFSPSGKRGRFPRGTTVLEAARQLGVDIDSICGGRALCGRCRVDPVAGRFPKENLVSDPDHLAPAGEAENAKLAQIGKSGRLSCQAVIDGDLRIDVPATSQVHAQVVRKDCEAHDFEIDPVLRLYYVEVPPPELGAIRGDLQRLQAALESEWGLAGLTAGMHFLASAQGALRAGGGKVTVAVREDRELAGIRPGLWEEAYGAAVDVGSTTIALHLCDLASGEVLASAGAMNPQIRFGEDLMSRVSYAMLHEYGAEEMTRAVRGAISDLLASAASEAGVGMEDILELVLVGNPVMHHLLLGLDPRPLGTAPFALATDAAVDLPARELVAGLAPGARAWLPPCIAGYVGADTAAVLLAETPWVDEAVSLIVDVGTNAEIVVGNRDRLLAASSPTGPAFEGAQVSGGQRAAPGAIERVRIDPDTLEPRFRIIGSELWSDEEGFEESITATGVTGICGSGIIEAIAGLFLAGVIGADGAVNGALAAKSSRIEPDGRTFAYRLFDGDPPVRITQGDIRAIQLAKAALHAGARLLTSRMGVERVDRIRLAGAFGSHIDVTYAMVLGLLPDCDLERVSSAANAAGTGARVALLNRSSREEISRRARQIEKVETAVDPDFQQYFVEAMALPHATQAYERLAEVVPLPEPSAVEPARAVRGRRRKSSA
jgi:uncharacterized 2Fe-2S/4Fe-4S cluster protein (DUF4445 family)